MAVNWYQPSPKIDYKSTGQNLRDIKSMRNSRAVRELNQAKIAEATIGMAGQRAVSNAYPGYNP